MRFCDGIHIGCVHTQVDLIGDMGHKRTPCRGVVDAIVTVGQPPVVQYEMWHCLSFSGCTSSPRGPRDLS